ELQELVVEYRGGHRERGLRQQRARQDVGNPRAGEVLARVAAAWLARIEQRGGVGRSRRHTVVVGDDHVQPDLAREGDLVAPADAAIHRHDQANARRLQPLQPVDVQTVAVAEAVRNVRLDPPPEGGQGAHEQRGARQPVDVVVAPDRDRLAGLDRLPNAAHRLRHAAEAPGVVERGVGRGQECTRVLGRAAAVQQQLRQDRRLYPGGVQDAGRRAGANAPGGGGGVRLHVRPLYAGALPRADAGSYSYVESPRYAYAVLGPCRANGGETQRDGGGYG